VYKTHQYLTISNTLFCDKNLGKVVLQVNVHSETYNFIHNSYA